MTQLILASATFGMIAVTFILVMVSLLLIGLVLLQKNRGSGLSGAFGGVGGHTAFGTKTGDFLTWVTVGLAFVFLLMSVVANFVFDRQTVTAENAPPPPAPTTPATPPIEITPSDTTGQATQTIPITPLPADSSSTATQQPPAAPASTPPATTPPAESSTPPATTPPAASPTTLPGQ